MIAVALSKDAVEPFIMRLTSGSAIVACINSPESVTISGDETAIFELESNLKANGIFARVLKVQNAYHSWHRRSLKITTFMLSSTYKRLKVQMER
jgi:acyl transferase domain-containing protein